MKQDVIWLQNSIIEFISILEDCMLNTTYEKDKEIYKNDIINATIWLIKLHKGTVISDVAKEISDSQTSKIFTDYWRNGKWGEIQGAALFKLQNKIKEYFKS